MKKFIAGLSFALLSAVAWALPTVEQVQQQVQQGHYTQAESMMKEVVDARPESAKAHYVYAELLARNGSFAKAATEAAKARELDPQIKFADPDKFKSFEQLLAREQATEARGRTAPSTSVNRTAPATTNAVAPARSESTGIPTWMWGAGLAVIAFLLWRGFSRSRAAAPMAGGPGYAGGMPAPGGMPGPNVPGAPYGQNYGGAPYGGAPFGGAPAQGAGSGMLRTGVAAAGGLAAGYLASEMLHRNQGGGANEQAAGLQTGSFGGIDTPSLDNAAANELENRNVDFGNGGDWDAGGGSVDGLGGSGSDDWN